jgi:cell wall-associated NlpC family hydrolase
MNLRRLAHTSLFIAAALLSACASAPKPSAAQEQAAQIAISMVGKPYHYGGNSPQIGFDCSGLVQYSYGRAGVRLPHGTEYLRRQSEKISTGDLRRGDLLFFNQPQKNSHVAIYIGGDRFVHAPSSGKTVYIASLSSDYWKKYFSEARRLDVD